MPHDLRKTMQSLFLFALLAIVSFETVNAQRLKPKQKPSQSQPNQTPQSDSGKAMAEIISANANLHESPNASSKIIRKVTLTEKLVLSNSQPVGAWYKVLDTKTGREGWLHGNTFKIASTQSESERTNGKQSPSSSRVEMTKIGKLPDKFLGEWVDKEAESHTLLITSDTIEWNRESEKDIIKADRYRLEEAGQKIIFTYTHVYMRRTIVDERRASIEVAIIQSGDDLILTTKGFKVNLDYGVFVSPGATYTFRKLK